MNVAKFDRGTVPMVLSQYNIRPVFDVHADVQGRDLNSVATISTRSSPPTGPIRQRPFGYLERPGRNHA